MNVKSLCLAILFDREATGYEIRKMSTEGVFSYFVEASYGSIYPALARLEEDGFVTSRVENQDGRPAKKIYAITPLGQQAFLETLFEELSPDTFRSEFVLFVRFAAHLPASLVEARLNEKIAQFEHKIACIVEAGRECGQPADEWVKNFGLNTLRASKNYLEQHKHELIALAQADSPAKAAE